MSLDYESAKALLGEAHAADWHTLTGAQKRERIEQERKNTEAIILTNSQIDERKGPNEERTTRTNAAASKLERLSRLLLGK